MSVNQNSVMIRQRAFIVFVTFLSLFYGSNITRVLAEGDYDVGFVEELFTNVPYDVDLVDGLEKEKQDPAIVRGRYVQVQFDYLVSRDIPDGAEAIKLSLFHNVMHTLVKERLEKRSENRYTWFGHIKDVKNSRVILVVENGSMAGNIIVEGLMYQIRKTVDGVHII